MSKHELIHPKTAIFAGIFGIILNNNQMRRPLFPILLTIFFISISSFSYSQSIILRGRVLDAVSKKGISGVHVILMGAETGTVTGVRT